MKKLLSLCALALLTANMSAQKNIVSFDSYLDLQTGISVGENKYSTFGIGCNLGARLINKTLFLGGGASIARDKYDIDHFGNGTFWNHYKYFNGRLYFPIHNSSFFVDCKLGNCEGYLQTKEIYNTQVDVIVAIYKDAKLKGPYYSFGAGIRMNLDEYSDVGLGLSYDHIKYDLKQDGDYIMYIGEMDNLCLRINYYFSLPKR